MAKTREPKNANVAAKELQIKKIDEQWKQPEAEGEFFFKKSIFQKMEKLQKFE